MNYSFTKTRGKTNSAAAQTKQKIMCPVGVVKRKQNSPERTSGGAFN
jgi:hypothetical protein